MFLCVLNYEMLLTPIMDTFFKEFDEYIRDVDTLGKRYQTMEKELVQTKEQLNEAEQEKRELTCTLNELNEKLKRLTKISNVSLNEGEKGNLRKYVDELLQRVNKSIALLEDI